MALDYKRSHTCGALSASDVGKTVNLSGWVHRRRDLGQLIFIDLRDRFGLTQLVFDPERNKATHEIASRLRSEWVITIRGEVRPRAPGMANTKLATGEIEIDVTEIEILSAAKTPPISVADDTTDVQEEARLKYRYLDIRRGPIAQKLAVRHRAMHTTRSYFDKLGFLEITTPVLVKSTPGGARNYLVPSRIYPGNFYALPESPQLFKQLLMVSGMDKYFQIATCFRDEDMRADRQPEFTQIDVEVSFCHPDDIIWIVEGLFVNLFRECIGKFVKAPFIRMTYADCMEYYGTDRPDLRFGMSLIRIDDIAKHSTFKVFLDTLASGGCIKALNVKKGSDISRRQIDAYIEFVKPFGLGGLAWLKVTDEGTSSSFGKFFTEDQLKEITSRLEIEKGDLVLVAAGPEARVNQGLDQLRRHIAQERKMTPEGELSFLWVTDFPLFRYNAEEGRIESEHHAFTAPHPDDIHLLDTDPLKVRALAYDIVLNGYEVGGGSQRIHNSELQEKIFHILKLSPDEIKEKFGFFVEALQYGTPPHLGIALGLDRIIMLLTGTDNIRDVIAFPKTAKATDLMTGAPAPVTEHQLAELQIRRK
ncbi:MAG: aspartate--tRNA ligase [Verrucomicrobia bacterium]|nr:aspartate--tRNA ligase [Verrucomicrobiota bacterium]